MPFWVYNNYIPFLVYNVTISVKGAATRVLTSLKDSFSEGASPALIVVT